MPKNSIIAGKTHFKILSMEKGKRGYWYKKLLQEGKQKEKEEAMQIVEVARCINLSAAMTGENNPMYNKIHTEEIRTKQRERMMGEKNHMYGKKGKNNPNFGSVRTKKTCVKISVAYTSERKVNHSAFMMKLWKDPEYRDKHTGKNNPMYGKLRPEHSERISGENHWNWQDGKSFEPYGEEFNDSLKEQIRKRDNFICQECGKIEEVLGCKLDVHHIDYDKTNNKPENLICLCKSCHAKTGFNREDWINYFKKIMKIYNVENKNLNIWVM